MKFGSNVLLGGYLLVFGSCSVGVNSLAARRKDAPNPVTGANELIADDDVEWLLGGGAYEARLSSFLARSGSGSSSDEGGGPGGGARNSDGDDKIGDLGRSIASAYWSLDQKIQECKARPQALRLASSAAVTEVQEAAGALSQVRGKLLQSKAELPESLEWRQSLQAFQAHSAVDCEKAKALQAEERRELGAEAARLQELEGVLKGQCGDGSSAKAASTAGAAAFFQLRGQRQWPENEVCARAHDAFDELQGELKDKITRLKADQEDTNKACESEIVFWQGQENFTSKRQEAIRASIKVASKLLENATKETLSKDARRQNLSAEVLSVEKSCREELSKLLGEIAELQKARSEKAREIGEEEPQDCQVTDWQESPCSVSCGGGTRSLTRQVLVPATNGGTCRPLQLQQKCSNEDCPNDCTLSTWSSWSACSAECDGGFQERRRNITTQPQGDGVPCGNLVSSRPCNSRACERDCILGDWSDWSTCSMPCHGGTQRRSREVAEPPLGSGFCPPQNSDVRLVRRPCNLELCAQATNASTCGSIFADMVFLVDNSGSIGQELLEAFGAVVGELGRRFPLDATQAQVALASFSETATLISNLTADGKALDNKIGSELQWGEGAAFLGRGLALAESLLSNSDTKNVPNRSSNSMKNLGLSARNETSADVQRARTVVVFTDGRISDAFGAQKVARRLRKEGIRLVYALVGRAKESSGLFPHLASEPIEENILFFPGREEFIADPASMAGKVLERTCYDLQG
mmetsp:Transcript_37357/g.79266  ORF Transcript_37357/g.79266 Transcript_37357/m.79266 type:complete len:754 (-) Transcript_37357:39-2300(-)